MIYQICLSILHQSFPKKVLNGNLQDVFMQYAIEVCSGEFPSKEHNYYMSDEVPDDIFVVNVSGR
jgi:hypothetical protein